MVRVGDTLRLAIDKERRAAIRRNHTAAHLLQAALREVLGAHVEQAGSYVDEREVRFDFTHFQGMSAKEIARTEEIVNGHILAAEPCETVVTDVESAKKTGATALFGEKYGDKVRVVRAGVSSLELCGGTHVANTGNIGLFRILSETSVAAGVRRIVGVTGLGVLHLLSEREGLIAETARELKAQNPADIAKKAHALQGEIKEAHREAESLLAKNAELEAAGLFDRVKTVGKMKLLTAKLSMRPDAARGLADTVKAKLPDGVAVFAVVSDGKLNFIAAAGPEAVRAGAHAGKILSEVSAVTGGKGGGRPDSAMSGGRDLDKIDAALKRAEEIVAAL